MRRSRENGICADAKKTIRPFASRRLAHLAASGDDLNILRVAAPGAFASSPVGSLPLDDENADFLRPTELPLNQYLPMVQTTWCLMPMPVFLDLSSPLQFSIDSQLSGYSAFAPLRC
jgi:hypothetical protein